MFKLRNIYAVISFEKTSIEILVCEKNNSQMHCLYQNSIKNLNYLDDNGNFINNSELLIKLQNLITSADNFIGLNITKYIVNLPNLQIKMFTNSTNNLKVDHNLSKKEVLDFIKREINEHVNDDEAVINIQPLQ